MSWELASIQEQFHYGQREKRRRKFYKNYLTLLGRATLGNGISEEEREKGAESLFKEIIAENFPNLGKKLDIQIHEANT